MFCFVSRRVSVAAIFVWSAAILLCTMPGPASAVPIEARLANIIGMEHTVKRGCMLACKDSVGGDTRSGDNSSSDVGPVTPTTPDGSDLNESPEGGDLPAPQDPETDTKPDGAPSPQVKTSAALGKNVNFSPISTWAIACTAGAAFALF